MAFQRAAPLDREAADSDLPLSKSRSFRACKKVMETRLHLHIGRPKTGSTAIQRFLAANVSTLSRRGFAIAQNGLYWDSHGPLAWSLYEEAARQFGDYYWDHCRQWADPSTMRGDLWDDLRAEIQWSAYPNLIVSTEELGVLSAAGPEVQSLLRDKLHGISVHVIVYVRRQDEFLASVYNEAVKGEELQFAGSFDDYVATVGHRLEQDLDHYSFCLSWARTFGEQNVSVRAYELEQLPGGVQTDFLETVGLGNCRDFVQLAAKENPGMSRLSLELLRRVNALRLAPDVRRKIVARLLSLDWRLSGGSTGSILPAAVRRRLIDDYRERNSALARELMHRPEGMLFVASEDMLESSQPVRPDDLRRLMQELNDICPLNALVGHLGD